LASKFAWPNSSFRHRARIEASLTEIDAVRAA
jgi:hypothetical protein